MNRKLLYAITIVIFKGGTCIGLVGGRKEGMGFYVAFNNSGHSATRQTRNREVSPFSSRIVPRGLSVAEGPWTALNNARHLYSDQANMWRLDPADSRLGARHRNH